MLEIQNVSKTFNAGTVNEKTALNGLNLKLNEGDFVTVIGGNGAGKSTMLNAVAGVWPVDEGKILIDGIDQLFPVEHILYITVPFDHFLNLRNTVGVSIIGMELYFNRSGERIITQKLFRISSHSFGLLLQCLFFRDIFGLFHERFLIQFFLKFQYIRFFHVVTDKNGETDILTDIYGKIVRRQYEKDNQS